MEQITIFNDQQQLGNNAKPAASPAEAVIQCVPNAWHERARSFTARFVCPEFTSLCPVTGQPDFAHLVIDYVPAKRLIESKSLKLFLASFRNHGSFHEACTIAIGVRLDMAAQPLWLRIGAYWYPRGGIPIDVFWQTNDPPDGLWIPPQDVPSFRGR